MQRAQDEMTRERSANGNLSGFRITDFADKDDVGILSEDVSQALREGETDLRLHLDLPDPRQLVLDRVFNRQDVAVLLVQFLERSVEGRRLATAGRTGDQQDAVRLMQ